MDFLRRVISLLDKKEDDGDDGKVSDSLISLYYRSISQCRESGLWPVTSSIGRSHAYSLP